MVCSAAVMALGVCSATETEPSLLAKIDQAIASRTPGRRLVLDLDQLSGGKPVFLESPLEIKTDNVELRGGVLLGGRVVKAKPRILDPQLVARIQPSAKGKVVELDLGAGAKVSGFAERGFGVNEVLSHTELIPWYGSSAEALEKSRPMRPAQWPNLKGPEGGWNLTGEVGGAAEFVDPSARPSRWATTEGVWTYGYWQFDWADQAARLMKWDPSKQQATLAEINNGALKSFGLAKGRRFYYLNSLEELDEPGEFWLDPVKGRVLAWLPDGVKEVIVSTTGGPLIKAEGKEEVAVTGTKLIGGRGPAIDFKDCRSCVIQDATILSPGGAGLKIRDGVGVTARRLTIKDAGEEGVSITGGDRPTLSSSRHVLEDSVIQRVSRWVRTYRPAVLLYGVGTRVSRCLMTDLPHTAVLFNGNDFIIEQNDIRRVCMETSDAGAIYTGRNPTMRGTVIRFNRFREMSVKAKTEGNYHAVICIYLDDCHAGIDVIGNIVESDCMGLMIGGGRDNKVVGNLFLNSTPPVSFDARAKGWAKKHFEEGWNYGSDLKNLPVLNDLWRKRYPALAAGIETKADFAWPEGCTFVDNVVLGPSKITYLDGLKQSDWQTFEGNVFREKPGGLEEALQLRPTRAIKIPWKEIGPRAALTARKP